MLGPTCSQEGCSPPFVGQTEGRLLASLRAPGSAYSTKPTVCCVSSIEAGAPSLGSAANTSCFNCVDDPPCGQGSGPRGQLPSHEASAAALPLSPSVVERQADT